MPRSSLELKRRRLVVAGSLLFLLACGDTGGGCEGGCGEGGCGTGATVPYPNAGEIVHQSAQIRLSAQGLEFIENNAGPLVDEVMGGEGLAFCIPPVAEPISACHFPSQNDCGAEGPGCLFNADIDHLEITPTDNGGSDSDQLDIRVVLTNIDERVPVNIFAGDCEYFRLQSDELNVDVSIIFNIDEDERTWIEVGEVSIDLDSIDASHDTPGGSITCDGYVGLVGLAGSLSNLINSVISDPIKDLITDALCISCDAGCPQDTTCDTDTNVCRYGDLTSCPPMPLGLEGAFDMGSLLGDMSSAEQSVLNYLFYLGDFADAENNGMTLAAQVGTYAEYDSCVPRRDPPSTDRVPKSLQLVSDLTPSAGTFMVGVGISKQILDLALWAAYNSGAVCLTIGAETVEQLTSSTFSILLRSLDTLTEDRNVPLKIALRPSDPPYVELGSGEVLSGDPPTILDPLITVKLDALEIDFFVWVEERFVRVFTLDTDIAIPLALTPSDEGTGIQILLGNLEEAFTRIEPKNAELLIESEVDVLAEVLPGLIASLLPALLETLAEPFELPAFFGYRISVEQDSFTSIEEDTMLAIFANLVPDTTTEGDSLMVAVPQSFATLLEVDGPSAEDITEFEALRDRDGVISLDDLRSRVVLGLDTIGPGVTGDREYTYRIDGGQWHLYRSGDQMVLRDAEFLLEGRHTVEVKSREPGVLHTMSLISDPVEVVIDLASPRVALYRVGAQEIEVEASDSVWADDLLTMRHRFGDGEWSEVEPIISIALPAPSAVDQSFELQVEVFDPAGRSDHVQRTYVVRRQALTNTVDEGCQSCAVAGSDGGGSSPSWLLSAFALLFVASRRRRANKAPSKMRTPIGLGLLSIAALGLALTACADGPTNAIAPDAGADLPRGCEGGCESDEICIGNACVPNVCTVDDDCPDDMACVDDICVLRIRCDNDSECPDGMFCIDDDDDGGSECIGVPCNRNRDCASLTCSGGALPFCIDDSCACELPCQEGCGEGEYCCNATRSCETLPSACEAMSCDVGFGPAVVTPAEGDPDSCQVTGPVCECQELPPLPLGDVGSYLSSAVGPDGTIYVSAFNRTYEDLMFGVVGDDDTIDWAFVDGAPDSGLVTGSLNGPRGGIADPGNRVGRYTSLAVGDDGTLHLTYFDRTERLLRYARGVESGGEVSWTISTIDDTDWAGLYTDIALASDGEPGVAYFVQRAEVNPGVWYGELRFAWSNVGTSTGWTIETVDSGRLPEPCGGRCYGATRCHLQTNSCDRTARASDCTPTCGGDQTCFEAGEDSAVCGDVISNPTVYTIDSGVGLFADAARFSNDDVGIAYYDSNNGNLRYTASSGQTFVGATPLLLDGEVPDGSDEDSLPDDTGDVGMYPSIAIVGEDVYVTYGDATNGDLKFLHVGNGSAAIVDAGVRGTSDEVQSFLVGDDSSLVLLADGSLQVAYMDSSNHDALVAQRSTDSGLWLVPAIHLGDEDPYAGAYGFFLNQLLIEGRTVLLSYRIHTREATRDVVVRVVE